MPSLRIAIQNGAKGEELRVVAFLNERVCPHDRIPLEFKPLPDEGHGLTAWYCTRCERMWHLS